MLRTPYWLPYLALGQKGPGLHPHKGGFLLELSAGGATPLKVFRHIASLNPLRDKVLPLPLNESTVTVVFLLG